MDEAAWRAARCGRVTASRVADVMRKGRSKGAPSASRARYLGELVAERLTGIPQDNGHVSADMQHGIDAEAEARAAYAFRTGYETSEGGQVFVGHPTIEMAGASPDTFVGEDGLAEIKSPATHTHITYLTTQVIPADYLTQMQWQMGTCERAWCDFVSYDPRLPENLSLFIKRVDRDDVRIAEMEAEVRKFLAELDEMEARLRGKEAA